MTKYTILFLASNPPNADRRLLDMEARSIRSELRASGYRDRFAFETRWALEPLDLLRELRAVKPVIVHFGGHGGQHGLMLQNAQGCGQPVSPEAIAEVVTASGAPLKLVVLSACHSDATARALIAHVDYVVGSSGMLHDDAARSFAIGFYGGLGEHESIARAYRQGCAAISLDGMPDAARPHLLVRKGADADRAPFTLDVSPQERPCPYPGMRPYSADEAGRFYGRRAEIHDLLARLRAGEREIYVIGASGSGKSSLVAAGVLPRLARGAGGLGSFIVRPMRPGEKPAARLHELLDARAPFSPPEAVTALLAHRGPNASLLIVIDQLEELFTIASTAERALFSTALRSLRAAPRCVVIFTLRADFFGKFLESSLWTDRDAPPWTDRRSRVSYLEVGPLTGPALREAITEPARAAEVEVEPALVERLLADTAHEPGSLPLLQETLLQLWEHRAGQSLTLVDYDGLGNAGQSGLAVALSRRADATLRSLNSAQVAIARRIFLRLISFGDGRPDTRRQQACAALRAAEDAPVDFTRVLEMLVASRLVTIDELPLGDEPVHEPSVDLAHEVMITAWPMLAGWVASHSADEQRRRELEARATQWDKHGRGLRGLLESIDLDEAVAWRRTESARALGDSTGVAALIAASAARRDRQRTIRRVITGGLLTTLSLVATIVVWLAITASRAAFKNERLLRQSYQNTGRQLLVDGHPEEAMPYLLTARQQGADDVPLQMLFGMAARLLPRVPPLEHRGGVLTAEFSPDGTRIVTASTDHSARVWDAATGKPVTPALQHQATVTRAVFSPDGARVATASEDRTARIWNAATGEAITEPLQHNAAVTDITFSQDGTRMMTATSDLTPVETVRLWDAVTGRLLGEPGRYHLIVGLAFLANSPRVMMVNVDGSVQIWDATTATPIGSIVGHNDVVRSAAFSPDGTRILTASRDKSARLWDSATGKPISDPLMHPAGVTGAVFSADGRFIATTSADHAAYVWNATTGDRLAGPLQHMDGVVSVRMSADGARVVTAGADHTARVWDVATGTPVTAPLMHPQSVNSVAFSPDAARVVTASADHAARIWDVTQGSYAVSFPHHTSVEHAAFNVDCTRVLTVSNDYAKIWSAVNNHTLAAVLQHQSYVVSAVFDRDGGRVLTASTDMTVRIWDAATGKELAELGDHKTACNDVAFAPDGTHIAAACDHSVHVWETASRRLIATFQHEGLVRALTFSPDSHQIATASSDHTARVWNVITGAPITPPLPHEQEVNRIEFSVDGTRVVTASNDDSARVWDATTGNPLTDPCWHQGSVLYATFSPDGTRIVTASVDQTARIWNVASGQALTSPLSHRGTVTSASFSPDGTRVVTASADKTARVWDATTGALLMSPLEHADEVHSVAFCADGARILTASSDGTARIWNIAPDRGTLEAWTEIARRSPFLLHEGVLVRRPPTTQ